MSNKYGFNEETGQALQLPAGIHEDVELYSIVFEALTAFNPTKVLKFLFRKENLYFRHTEFPVEEEVIARWSFRKSNFTDMVRRKYLEQGERLKHIFIAITGDAHASLEKENWEDFCRNYLSMVNNRNLEKHYCIKIV